MKIEDNIMSDDGTVSYTEWLDFIAKSVKDRKISPIPKVILDCLKNCTAFTTFPLVLHQGKPLACKSRQFISLKELMQYIDMNRHDIIPYIAFSESLTSPLTFKRTTRYVFRYAEIERNVNE